MEMVNTPKTEYSKPVRGTTCNKSTHIFKPQRCVKQLTRTQVRDISELSAFRKINAHTRFTPFTSFTYIDFNEMLINKPEEFKLYLRDSIYEDAIVSYLSSYRENVLHVACKLDLSDLVQPLLRLGCNAAKQNYGGRTPFHVALDNNHINCIEEFLCLMRATGNDKQITQSLKNMFKPYDNCGYTIIHQAVLKDQPKVVDELLQFCLQHNIDVLASEVLGCGDSLLHLAVKGHRVEIAKIIVRHLPESLNVKNYGAVLAYDIDGVSKDMRKYLKVHHTAPPEQNTTNRFTQFT